MGEGWAWFVQKEQRTPQDFQVVAKGEGAYGGGAACATVLPGACASTPGSTAALGSCRSCSTCMHAFDPTSHPRLRRARLQTAA
jgi:hypothetical protein